MANADSTSSAKKPEIVADHQTLDQLQAILADLSDIFAGLSELSVDNPGAAALVRAAAQSGESSVCRAGELLEGMMARAEVRHAA